MTDLRVISDEPLPSLVAEFDWRAIDGEDVVFRASTDAGSWLRLRMHDDRQWVEFVIDPPGSNVWVSTSPNAPWDEVAELLLGAVFSAILAQRGRTCLHAGVVQFADRVIALLGDKGAGKSTTSLALIRAGGVPVSDDVALLHDDVERPEVAVGPPRLRTRRNTAELVLGSYDQLAPMWTEEAGRPEKRYFEVSREPLGEWVAIDTLYLLAFDDAVARPELRTLSPVEAIPRLMAMRHVPEAIPESNLRHDFARVSRLATSVPVRELTRPHDVTGVEACVRLVTADLAHVA